jgi:hypothetical protein
MLKDRGAAAAIPQFRADRVQGREIDVGSGLNSVGGGVNLCLGDAAAAAHERTLSRTV